MNELHATRHSETGLSGEQLRARVTLEDDRLLAECTVHTYRASGPGGQKRNKTSSAVRLHHQPTGLIAPAEESRSQHENKARALRRLREMFALQGRQVLPTDFRWPDGVQIHKRRLAVSEKNPGYLSALALALDALHTADGRLSDAAARLDVTSSSLTRFLRDNPRAWTEANRIRAANDLSPLRA